ncbi:hypothetical protein GCM10027445_36920 [Amycolatopsis endophytica]|uniref:DUF305 domain-containing protein n=1 Tax=Amycolatopsis endophytica TaxID=860233 RepID=A0A853B6Y8_9PSEU|nr:hypothetical protein [Amycolatopsis endophytica]NYI91033.1 hypothetical protein [Amycolatopsis endophytica]
MRTGTICAGLVLASTLAACSGSSTASYVDSAVVTAQEGVSAVGTLHEIIRAHGEGRLFPTFTTASVDDVLATATKALDELEAPTDPETQQVYDELHPRLQDAVARASEAREALDAADHGRVAAVDAQLVRVNDELTAFVESHR